MQPVGPNAAEATFRAMMLRDGYEVTKQGWPDFLVLRHGEVIACVEVKSWSDQQLRPWQKTVMAALKKFGIPCYRWSLDSGFQHIDGKRTKTAKFKLPVLQFENSREPVKCPSCNRQFKNGFRLRQHFRMIHNEGKPVTVDVSSQSSAPLEQGKAAQ